MRDPFQIRYWDRKQRCARLFQVARKRTTVEMESPGEDGCRHVASPRNVGHPRQATASITRTDTPPRCAQCPVLPGREPQAPQRPKPPPPPRN